MSVCFCDLETTGTDPERHRVWEIALITDDGEEHRWILELAAQEIATAEPYALHITDYYRRAAEAARAYEEEQHRRACSPTFENEKDWDESPYVPKIRRDSLVDYLAGLIGTSHLVGAVPSFDARFLGDLMRKHERPPSWHYHLVDVEALAAGVLGWEPPWKSKDLYAAIGVTWDKELEHTAMGDTRMAKAVYEQVMSGRARKHVLSQELKIERGAPSAVPNAV